MRINIIKEREEIEIDLKIIKKPNLIKARSKNNKRKNKRWIRRSWNKNIRNRDRSIKIDRKNSKKIIEGIEKLKIELKEIESKEIVDVIAEKNLKDRMRGLVILVLKQNRKNW